MSDYIVFFPYNESQAEATFDAFSRKALTGQQTGEVTIFTLPRCRIAVSEPLSDMTIAHNNGDDNFMSITKGIMFDCENDDPIVSSKAICSALRDQGTAALGRYEGTFASCNWDETSGRGYIFNDQLCQMSLYYIETDGGLYVSTNSVYLGRGLGLGLDPLGVQELLAQGVVRCPYSMIKDVKRLNVGEVLEIKNGRLTSTKIWSPCGQHPEIRSREQNVENLVTSIKDRCKRYYQAASRCQIVCDITAGFDSRLIAATLHSLELDFSLTVNGPLDHIDVRIGHDIARACDLPIRYFDTSSLSPDNFDQYTQYQLLYKTRGELPFNNIYQHSLSRPALSNEFGLHFSGNGGEFFRFFPWIQEVFGIGKRRLANVDRALRYRYAPKTKIQSGLFRHSWYIDYENRLRRQLLDIFTNFPESPTTVQLDAAYAWKNTGPVPSYISSTYGWLPTAAPFLTAGVVETATSVHWPIRLTSRLQRQVIQRLSPVMARVRTQYGGTGEPADWRHILREAKLITNFGGKMIRTADRVVFGGRVGRNLSWNVTGSTDYQLDFTPMLETTLQLGQMRSESMYEPKGISAVIQGANNGESQSRDMMERMATVELLCREMMFDPDDRFLVTD